MRLLGSRVGQAGRILSPVAWIARLSRSNRWLGASRARRAAKHRSCRFMEERTVELEAPPQGARFKGYTDYVVQDWMIRPHVVNFRCERWQTADGAMMTAPLPAGISGHFGAETDSIGPVMASCSTMLPCPDCRRTGLGARLTQRRGLQSCSAFMVKCEGNGRGGAPT